MFIQGGGDRGEVDTRIRIGPAECAKKGRSEESLTLGGKGEKRDGERTRERRHRLMEIRKTLKGVSTGAGRDEIKSRIKRAADAYSTEDWGVRGGEAGRFPTQACGVRGGEGRTSRGTGKSKSRQRCF